MTNVLSYDCFSAGEKCFQTNSKKCITRTCTCTRSHEFQGESSRDEEAINEETIQGKGRMLNIRLILPKFFINILNVFERSELERRG
mmetsp:Transcript_7257/g.10930  ORF Transcript_7257/g.10930 Transcript_7257/m.10930 type:complete len:87 (+) Transcript_7257:1245-1505(+)